MPLFGIETASEREKRLKKEQLLTGIVSQRLGQGYTPVVPEQQKTSLLYGSIPARVEQHGIKSPLMGITGTQTRTEPKREATPEEIANYILSGGQDQQLGFEAYNFAEQPAFVQTWKEIYPDRPMPSYASKDDARKLSDLSTAKYKAKLAEETFNREFKVKTEQKGIETAIKKEEKLTKPLSTEAAGRLSLVDEGLKSIKEVRGIVFDKSGNLNKSTILDFNTGIPFTENGKKLYTAFYNALDGQVRSETGAAMTPSEFKSKKKEYGFNITDNPESVKFKLDKLENLLRGTKQKLDPQGKYSLNKPSQTTGQSEYSSNEIKVRQKSTGKLGYIDKSEFNSNEYDIVE